jgi:hypothetical protein
VLGEHINKTSVCKNFKIVKLTQPVDLSKKDYEENMGKRMIWETTMKSFIKRTDLMESNVRGIYAVVWGQCSPMMQSKLESLGDYSSGREHGGSTTATASLAWSPTIRMVPLLRMRPQTKQSQRRS